MTEFSVPPTGDDPPVPAGEVERVNAERGIEPEDHDCMEHAVPCTTDGPLGHGWECGKCGAFLQAG